MQKIFQVNQILIAVLGLPTMAVFIYEDSVGLFENLQPWATSVAWLLVVAAIILSFWQACALFLTET